MDSNGFVGTDPGGSVRALNMASCAAALRDHGEGTVTQVAGRTGLSRPTVEAVLAALLAHGIVSESASRTPGGRGAGRPARLYTFRPESGAFIGVDIGRHRVQTVTADLAGHVIGMSDAPLAGDLDRCARLDAVARAIQRAVELAHVSIPTAIGIAVPGLVGDDGQVIVSHVIPEWDGISLTERFGSEFGCPIYVENDIRLASLAEHHLGAARACEDVMCLFVGHRVSMGLILGGAVRRGSHSAAGEVGDLVLSQRRDETGELRWTAAESAAEVFRRAADGHAAAIQEIARFTDELSWGVATLAMGIDPDLIVIGGGVSKAGEALLEPLRAAVQARITIPVSPRIELSELGAEAVLLGALSRACSAGAAHGPIPEPTIDLHGLLEVSE